MLVSSSSMKVAKVTVMAMNQGLMATGPTREIGSGAAAGPATAWVLISESLSCLHRILTILIDVYDVYTDAKIKPYSNCLVSVLMSSCFRCPGSPSGHTLWL